MIAKTTYSQSSLDMFGYAANSGNSKFRLNSFEWNPQNYTQNKNWELSFTYGGELVSTFSSNIYLIGISKQIENHNLYARFTPGIQKEFILNTGTSIITADSSEVKLETEINFEEIFGFGYSLKISPQFSTGFNLRYFKQSFNEEELDPFFSIDSQNIITTKVLETNSNYWRGDFGMNYSFNENFSASLSSVNLIILNESPSNSSNENYKMRTDKKAVFGVEYLPYNELALTARIETDASFILGINSLLDLGGGNFSFGIAAFHDKYQTPFIAGILPSLNYSTDFLSFTISGIQYFTDRTSAKPLNDFLETGVNNLFNNQYSGSKYFASVNFALSFNPEKLVRFTDIQINGEIFPTLADEYINKPFAIAKVINLSDKKIAVKPSSYVPLINDDIIYSPTIHIAGKDSAVIPFFTIIHSKSEKIGKREIGEANFYLTTESSNPDDEIQKPVLINDHNAWDGKVINLRYFVQNDIEFSHYLAKDILSEKKDSLIKVPSLLSNFEKIKILFNEFSKNMIYVSDPRASVERVQFPSETMKIKGGDCDDLSVSLSSLLESVGIQTAFVDFKEPDGVSHVNLLVNTGLPPQHSSLITNNDKKYFIRKNVTGKEEVWIPIETTSQRDFYESWEIASEKFHDQAVNKLGLVKGSVEIIDVY
ncbi:MAG: hypothetical protein D8M61_07480 [Ignavibacteriae bacterium]|nr:hypothetical protein [Ignavibacteriota bacterium]